jgi:hypothetical protein
MKIIIFESQQRTIKEKVIFKMLDMQKYNLIEINNRIYFAKKIGDEYAEIRYDKSDGWCYLSYDLISFLSSITSSQRPEVQVLIVKWVEHTLQMEVKCNIRAFSVSSLVLNIPYKWR